MATGYSMCDNCNHVPMCGMRYTWEPEAGVTDMERWGSALCAKAYGLMGQLLHPGRLLQPMRRTRPKHSSDPGFEPISWDEAYALMAEKLLALKEQYGPHCVFFYCGAPKEPRPAVQRLAALFGSANYGTESSTACMRATAFASHLTYGWVTQAQGPDASTRLMLLWGVNPAVAHHYGMPALLDARDRGCRFVIIDPRRTTTLELLGGLHLRPRLGQTAALAHGMARVILRAGLHDEAFCRAWLHGFDRYAAMVDGFDVDRAAALSGVPAGQIEEAAHLLAEIKPMGYQLSAQSTTHSRNGVNNQRAIYALLGLLGAVAPGSAPVPALPGFDIWANGGPPAFGLRQTLLDMAPQRMDYQTMPAWARWAFEVNTSHLPERIADKSIRAFIAFGCNAMIWPSPQVYAEAMAGLDLGVAVDYFYRPESHYAMDLLLPAAMNFERAVPPAVKGRMFTGRTALTPAGEARDDWRIALELGTALGFGEECFHGDAEAACDAMLAPWGISCEGLRQALPGSVEATVAAVPPAREGASAAGYPTPSGKIELWSDYLAGLGFSGLPEYVPPYEPTPEYPFQLITGTRRPHLTHSRTRGDCPWLLELDPLPELELNPDDAARLNIEAGQQLLVASAWGEVTLHARPDQSMPPGMVGAMHGWSEADINRLIPREFDPLSGYAPYKEVCVNIRPLTAKEAS